MLLLEVLAASHLSSSLLHVKTKTKCHLQEVSANTVYQSSHILPGSLVSPHHALKTVLIACCHGYVWGYKNHHVRQISFSRLNVKSGPSGLQDKTSRCLKFTAICHTQGCCITYLPHWSLLLLLP